MARAGNLRRIAAWAACAAFGGLALGFGIGAYRVTHLDCSRPLSCEWSGFLPIVFAFWGFWGGLVLGVIAALLYLENKSPRGDHDRDKD